MSFEVKMVSSSDDLIRLVESINKGDWDEGNEIEEYAVDSLRAYLEQPDTFFLVCLHTSMASSDIAGMEVAGMASGRFQHKPYAHCKWLYIDEIDTCVNFRRQGVATAMMQELLLLARQNDCEEVWLGAEKSNDSAKKFYQSLHPSAVDAVIGYTFEID